MFKEDIKKIIDNSNTSFEELGQYPLISIIIPTCNRSKMLKEAINSILKQDYSNYEIIIIDDFSLDDTEKCIKESYNKHKNIKYYKNPCNMGAGFSRKFGYSKAKGEYIVFFDDDDYYIDDSFFKKAIYYFEKNENISFVGSNSLIKYEKNNEYKIEKLNIKGIVNNIEYLENFQTKFMKPNSTFTSIFSKKMLDRAEFENLQMVNDSSIYLRAILSGNAYILKDIIGVYRIHDKNITFNLKLDFLIENLKEKKYIYDQIYIKKILTNPEKWWYDQIKLTADYYINSSKITIQDFQKLLKWCIENTKINKDEINDMLIEIWENKEK